MASSACLKLATTDALLFSAKIYFTAIGAGHGGTSFGASSGQLGIAMRFNIC